MSLLTVAQAVAEEVGLTAPSTVIGNADKFAKQLLRLINRSGKILAKKNWAVLQREHSFATVASTASYDLPSDFQRLLDQSGWDRTLYWQLRGPLSPSEWQVRKSALVASATLRTNFRIKADTRVNKFFLDPTPDSVRTIVFEYGSDLWVKDTGNTTGKTAYAVDSDVSLISEELLELDCIWRLLSRKGFAYEEEKREAERQIDRAFAEDGGAVVIDLGGARSSHEFNIPEGSWS